MSGNEAMLELRDITKVFPGVTALNKVHLSVYPGEVHALCGENGAGKSTLMKIISGAQMYTSGTMLLHGQKIKFSSTKEAEQQGISMIYQEFNLLSHLTVAENIFLGRYPKKKSGFIDWAKMNDEAKKILNKISLEIDPKKQINACSVGEMQMIEIAKCLSVDSKIIIMDEPTAALTDEEADRLFAIIDNLKTHGIAVIYISHRMKEIFQISDRITVFRDGMHIQSMLTKDTDNQEIVRLMVGRDLSELYPPRQYKKSDTVVLEAKHITYKKLVNNVSFKLHQGEILGLAGLLGSGNIALSKLICGYYGTFEGDVKIMNTSVQINTPIDAINNHMFMVSDDRKREGLILLQDVKGNISLSSLSSIIKKRFISPELEREKAMRQVKKLQIKVSSVNQTVGNLSGGNQQKVVFGKMLETKPQIIFMAEPTRGIDVGAKSEIYSIMNSLTEQGISIVLISSDLPELIGMSDRVIVMKNGEINGELLGEDLTQEQVLSYATGFGGNDKND